MIESRFIRRTATVVALAALLGAGAQTAWAGAMHGRPAAAETAEPVATAVSAQTEETADIVVEQAWLRPTIGRSRNSAAYMSIRNRSGQPDRLLSAAYQGAEVTEIHQSTFENNVMKMAPLRDGVEIPANETFELAPMGHHIMLIGLQQPLRSGQTITLQLTFERAGSMQVQAEVKKLVPSRGGVGGNGGGTTDDSIDDSMDHGAHGSPHHP